MTATNHVVTGAVVVALIDKPLIAIPVAFLTHFALDALPHFGAKERDMRFLVVLATDMGFAASILLAMAILGLPNWPWLVAGGIACASPDLMWLYYLIYELKGQKKKLIPIAKFHAKIQWSETKLGIIIELVWFFLMSATLFRLTI